MLKSIIQAGLDLLFPNICVGCQGEAILSPSIFCSTCASHLPYTGLESERDNEFEKHFTGRILIEAGSALFYLSKGGVIQKAIYDLKYRNLPHIGYEMGLILGARLKQNKIFNSCDGVIGVPLHSRKKMKRGYNQADYIAKGIAEAMSIPNLKGAVVRRRQTSTQTRKTRLQRMINMSEGFSIAQPDRIAGRHVLLVDDVLTSGATLDYCGQQILSQPGTKLSLATLAMGSVI